MADRVGQQLGNYQLIRLLGEGGFAQVYLGEHIHLGTQAAIKVLHTQLTSDDVGKFRTEARTIARLIHPHIVRVLEFGIESKTPFLVMDYAPNGTLRQRHPKGIQLPLTTIVSYVKQVADALQYAHDEKLIHRDIKPENMLLGRRNEILLSDFGIALIAQSSRYQSAQEMAGTMAYMAPEQIQGKPRPASDQYSLGIVVYEWLSGDRPFHGSLTELVGQHLSTPPPSLQEKVSTISSEVEQVVLIALAKDPKERFASVQVFATVLDQAYQSSQHYPPASSVIASPTSQSPLSNLIAPSPSQSSLHTDAVEAILPDLSPLPTNTVIPQSHSPQSTNIIIPPSQPLQPTNLVTPPASLSQPTTAAAPTYTPAVSPPLTEEPLPSSGSQPTKRRISRRTVLVGLAGLAVAGSGITWLARSRRPQVPSPHLGSSVTPTSIPTPTLTPTPTRVPLGTTLLTYSGHTTQVNAVAWSPDGKRIASGSLDSTVQVWDATSGNQILTYHSGQVVAVSWSPDGKRIATGGIDGTVQVWDTATGNTIFGYRGHFDAVFAVAWSPDGKRIASGGVDGTVQVWSAASGHNLFTYHGLSGPVRTVIWSSDGTYIASGGGPIDNAVRVWNTTTGETIVTYNGHSDVVYALAWSPDGKRIASGSGDKTVQVWNSSTGRLLLTYRGHSKQAQAIVSSPNKNYFSSWGGRKAGYAVRWTSNKESMLSGSSIGVFGLAWSPDGKRIASGGGDETVQIWDATVGNQLYIYHGHSNLVTAVAWSPDGKRIASGSEDATVQLWQAS